MSDDVWTTLDGETTRTDRGRMNLRALVMGYTYILYHPEIGEPLYFRSPEQIAKFLSEQHPNLSGVRTKKL